MTRKLGEKAVSRGHGGEDTHHANKTSSELGRFREENFPPRKGKTGHTMRQ